MRIPPSSPGVARSARFRVGGAFFSALLLVPAFGLAGQEPPATVPSEVHGLQSRPTALDPSSGPPGTSVTIRGSFLPAITPVQVALGGTQSGFEALRLVLTNRSGDLEEVVEIPEWAKRDRAHRFIIFDAYFNPLAASALFHVTDAEGLVVRQGTVDDVTASCVVLLGEDQERYILVGADPGMQKGDNIEVEGRLGETTSCGEGLVVEVVRVTDRP